MNVIEAIYQRKSIRGYKPDPVSRNVLTRVLEAACRAPSAMNTQPWEFVVVGGDVLKGIRAEIVDKLNRKEPMHPDHEVVSWSNDSVYRGRQVELAKKIFERMDIQREDQAKRAAWL